MVKKAYSANVEGNRGRRGTAEKKEDKVKDLLLGRGLSERERMRLARDRNVWVGMISE